MLCHDAVGADVQAGVEAVAQLLDIMVLQNSILCGARLFLWTFTEPTSAGTSPIIAAVVLLQV